MPYNEIAGNSVAADEDNVNNGNNNYDNDVNEHDNTTNEHIETAASGTELS